MCYFHELNLLCKRMKENKKTLFRFILVNKIVCFIVFNLIVRIALVNDLIESLLSNLYTEFP